jgi:hypothetical protein
MPRINQRKLPVQDSFNDPDESRKEIPSVNIPRYSRVGFKPTLKKRRPVLGYAVFYGNNTVIVSLETLHRAGITAEIADRAVDGRREVVLRVMRSGRQSSTVEPT